jgi:two-component system cell cycle sensor histidine kinase/response regulator CckA
LAEADVHAHPPAKAGPHIAITMSDTGCGIPPENIERIFDPFFSTKVRERGTGLGLSTAFGIVHSHEGFITVESVLERGATFTVYLPAAAKATVAATVPAEPERHGQGELILVVDDEPMVRRCLNLVLTMHGYEVAMARNGAEAVEVFRQRADEVRLVVTDLMMPVMGGVELIRLLHAQAARLRIVAFSGVDSPVVRAELVAAGVDCFLTKPCVAPELLAAIARQLDESNR